MVNIGVIQTLCIEDGKNRYSEFSKGETIILLLTDGSKLTGEILDIDEPVIIIKEKNDKTRALFFTDIEDYE